MENPTLEFLVYLLKQCINQCDIDPDRTSVSKLIAIISEAEMPMGC